MIDEKELKEYLQWLVEDDDAHDHDWNPMDAYGGNIDDAYDGGRDEGVRELAYTLLHMFWNSDAV